MKIFFHHIGQKGIDDLEKTVLQTVQLSDLRSISLAHSSHEKHLYEELESAFAAGSCNVWGVPRGGSTIVRRMNVGDLVLLVKSVSGEGEVPALCLVKVFELHEYPNLSRALWGSDDYPYVYFFDTIELSLTWRQMTSDLGYSENYNPRGRFYSIGSDRLERFGGAEGYFRNLVSNYTEMAGTKVFQIGEGRSRYYDPSHSKDYAIFAPVEVNELPKQDIALPQNEIECELRSIERILQGDPKLTEEVDDATNMAAHRIRSAAFRLAVRRLYGNRCCICGSSLLAPDGFPEVEAAHIYPKYLNGSDDIRNGICLCRLHHWAFDCGWISILDDLEILVKSSVPTTDNYRAIASCSGKKIETPFDSSSRPHRIYLESHRKLHGFT